MASTRRGRHRIAYEAEGDGPRVVLIQGLGMSGRMWLDTPRRLLDAGFSVATLDNRGTGASSTPPPPYRMASMADDVARVISSVGGAPVIVAGISLGGMIAQHVVLRHPRLVRGLVLAATTCGLPFGRLPAPSTLAVLVRGMLGDERALPALRELLVHRESAKRNPAIFREWDRMIQAEPVRWQAVLGQLAAVATHHTYGSLGRMACPTEVITGDSDVLVPTANSRILARRIPRAKLTVLPRACHAFPLEVPTALVDAIVRVHVRSDGASRSG